MKGLLFLIFVFNSYLFFAQKRNIEFQTRYKNGFMIAHRPIMSHLPKEHLTSFEFSILCKTNGSKDWHKALNYPTVGVSSLFTTGGNKEIVGNFCGTEAFLQFNPLNKEKSKIFIKIASGLGYAFKVFNQETNPKNVVISSHWNALINFAAFYQYNFKQNNINIGLDMTHFSNGASKLPNLGINLCYFTLAYGRKIQEVPRIEKELQKVNSDWKYSAIAIMSQRGGAAGSNAKYGVYALSLTGQKAFSYGLGYETGIDLMYKTSLERYKPVIPKTAESIMQIGFYNGYFLSLKRMQIHLGMGVYLRDEYFADDRMYHRMGFIYTFDNGLLMNLTLKSHWAKADYVEYGIGYRF